MAQEIESINGMGGLVAHLAGRPSSLLWSRMEEEKRRVQSENTETEMSVLSGAVLNALGDDSSRRILASAIACGKTVEDISAEQGLPLSTCYRRIRYLVDEGLMILERTVITRTGKRYAVYRTSFSEATIAFSSGRIVAKVVPNPDVLDKLRRRSLSAEYPPLDHGVGFHGKSKALYNASEQTRGPFE